MAPAYQVPAECIESALIERVEVSSGTLPERPVLTQDRVDAASLAAGAVWTPRVSLRHQRASRNSSISGGILARVLNEGTSDAL